MPPADSHADDAFRPPTEALPSQPPAGVVGFVVGRILRLIVSPLVLVIAVRIVWPAVPTLLELALVGALAMGLWIPPSAILFRTRLFPQDPGPRAVRVGGQLVSPMDHRWSARAITLENFLATLPLLLLAVFASLQSGTGLAFGIVFAVIALRNLVRAQVPWLMAEARVALRLGRPRDARRWLAWVLRLPLAPPIPDQARLLEARAHFFEAEPESVLDALDRLDDPERHSALVLRAQVALSRGDAGPARALLAEPRPADPDALAHRVALGGLVALVDGDEARAEKLAGAWEMLRDATRGDLTMYELIWAAAWRRVGQSSHEHRALERAGGLEGPWVATMWPML